MSQKTYTSVPDNFRQLSASETIRAEDIYRNETTGAVQPTKFSIGKTVGNYTGYTFWRRRHTKAAPKRIQPWRLFPQTSPALAVISVPQDEPKKPVTIVTFWYNNKFHTVQVIKLDDTYLKGLDITVNRDEKREYQFKTFRLDRVAKSYGIRLSHFGEPLS